MSNIYAELAKYVMEISTPVSYTDENNRSCYSYSINDVTITTIARPQQIISVYFHLLGVNFAYTQNQLFIAETDDEVQIISDKELRKHIMKFVQWRVETLKKFGL